MSFTNKLMSNQDIKQIISRIEKLEKVVFGNKPTKNQVVNKEVKQELNFNLNPRAFVTRFVADKSGPKKFVLVIAYLAKGKQANNIKVVQIKEMWEKMKAKTLLGKYNDFYPNSALTRGWVNSIKYGSYCLTNEWKDVIK